MAIIGRGQLTLSDLNDAIISGTQPSSPTIGTLWIDNSINPNMLKQWNGSAWINLGELDPNLSETISDIQETLGNMANDNKIDFNERQVIREKISKIIGYTPYDKNVSKDNFIGKISASTSVNPHLFKRAWATTLQPPTSGSFAERSQATYDLITILDGNKDSLNTSVNGEIPQAMFSFDVIQLVERKMGLIPSGTLANKVAWVKANVKSITVKWHGHGTSPTGNKATLGCWHVTNANWTTNTTNHTQAIVSQNTMIIDGSIPNSIDSNGFIHFLAYSNASNGTMATIHTDFIEIETIMYNTMPTVATLDGLGYGDFYNVRRQAVLATVSVSDTKYVALASEYTNLKVYLESSPVVDAWDVSQLNRDAVIDVNKAQFRDTWLKFYTALNDLATLTAEQLKKNVDNVAVGGTNYIPNGHFEIDLTKSLWSSSYVGGIKEIVDISTEAPPFQFAYHVKNTTNMNGGIFMPNVWTGVVAEKLVDKEVTVSFWLRYANIVQGVQTYQLGRFGELVVEGETAGGAKVYTYNRVNLSNNTSTSSVYTSGLSSPWGKYYATHKLSLPPTAIKLTNIMFKHGLEACTGEFWTTGIQLEIGNKVTDFAPSPLDVQDRLKKAELKITDEAIVATVTGSTNWTQISQKANRIDIVVNPADSTIKADDIATSISLSPTALNLIAQNISLTGNVTFNSLNNTVNGWKQSGKTTINGGQIETNTISASSIKTNELIVGTNVSMGANASISWSNVSGKPTIPNSTYIDANGVYTGTVQADKITGGLDGISYSSIATTKSVTINNGVFISNDCGSSSGGVINQQTTIEDGRIKIRSNVADREIRITSDSIDFWSLNDGTGTDSSSASIEYYLDGSLNDVIRIDAYTLDLSWLTTINWGTNKPQAVFG